MLYIGKNYKAFTPDEIFAVWIKCISTNIVYIMRTAIPKSVIMYSPLWINFDRNHVCKYWMKIIQVEHYAQFLGFKQRLPLDIFKFRWDVYAP